jgi:hypothetical protein
MTVLKSNYPIRTDHWWWKHRRNWRTEVRETLTQRIARQMAENNPGVVTRVASSTAPAQGEREKLG